MDGDLAADEMRLAREDGVPLDGAPGVSLDHRAELGCDVAAQRLADIDLLAFDGDLHWRRSDRRW
jgi:hypothetical protein